MALDGGRTGLRTSPETMGLKKWRRLLCDWGWRGRCAGWGQQLKTHCQIAGKRVRATGMSLMGLAS